MKNLRLRFQTQIIVFTLLVFGLKLYAWFLTDSVAVFTDAMESTVNIATAFFGFYAIWLSGRPQDKNHPYGHGKVEFLAAVIEGSLICFTSFIILYQAITHLNSPQHINALDYGTIFLGITCLFNFLASRYWHQQAKKHFSPTIEATAKHLQMDAISTAGIIVALLLMHFTHIYWLDPIIGIVIGLYILYEGIIILRKSIAGIMDEADFELLKPLIHHINEERARDWIDLHNLRVIQYGNRLHIDAHITIPWYYNIQEGHDLIEQFNIVVEQYSEHHYEFFLHVDPCQPFSCEICAVENCPVRQNKFKGIVAWDLENVLKNKKHNK